MDEIDFVETSMTAMERLNQEHLHIVLDMCISGYFTNADDVLRLMDLYE